MEYRGTAYGTFRAPPRGIILHASRSGVAGNPLTREFLGTCRWVETNPKKHSWHATIGPNVYASHLLMTEVGAHCASETVSHNREWLGAEFSQPTVDDAIGDEQVAAFASWYRQVVAPAWPHLAPATLLLPSHSEMRAGRQTGNSDPYPVGDARLEDLRARIYAALAGPTAPSNPYWDQIGDGLRAYIRQRGDAPVGPERFVHDPDRPGQNITSHVDGEQRAYTYHHDAKRVTVRSYEPLTPPG